MASQRHSTIACLLALPEGGFSLDPNHVPTLQGHNISRVVTCSPRLKSKCFIRLYVAKRCTKSTTVSWSNLTSFVPSLSTRSNSVTSHYYLALATTLPHQHISERGPKQESGQRDA